MVVLLQKKDNVKFLAICTDCLHLLGYGDQASKVQMIHAGAAVQLVYIMNQYQYEKVEFIRLETSKLSKMFFILFRLAIMDHIESIESIIKYQRK